MDDDEWMSHFPKVSPSDFSPQPCDEGETCSKWDAEASEQLFPSSVDNASEPSRGSLEPSDSAFEAKTVSPGCAVASCESSASTVSAVETEEMETETNIEIPEIVRANADLKLYDCSGAATRRVRMFLIETGLDWILKYLTQMVDYLGMENRTEAFLEKTPSGTLPVLQAHGVHITESTIICEYLEDRFGIAGTERSLYGRNAEEKAVTASWVQKLLWYITDPLEVMGRSSEKYRHFFMNRTFVFTGADEQLQQRVKWGIDWLENTLQRRFRRAAHLIDSDWYICEHNRFSMADIVLLAHLDADLVFENVNIIDQCPLLSRLLKRLRSRPSAQPSCHVYYSNMKA